MGTDIPAYNYLLKLVDKGWLLIGLVAHLVGHLLVVSFTYRKIPMMKTFTIVLSVLLILGITIKANGLPTFPDSLVPPSTTNSASNCMMQVMDLSDCQLICTVVPACKGYTYCSNDANCYLKKDGVAGNLQQHDRCVSGSKSSYITYRNMEIKGHDLSCPDP